MDKAQAVSSLTLISAIFTALFIGNSVLGLPDGSFPADSQPSSHQQQQECSALNAVLVLRCLSPLIEYTQTGQASLLQRQFFASQNRSIGLNALGHINPDRICRLYDDYRYCAPESVRSTCRYFVSSVESVYEYVCSEDVRANFSRSFDCISTVEQNTAARECQKNATDMLREAATSNVTTDERMDMQCGAINSYFKCAKASFVSQCGEDGWLVKRETTMRATAAGVANCSFSPPATTEVAEDFPDTSSEDFNKPLCDRAGNCTCQPGLVLEDNVCKDYDDCANDATLCSQRCHNAFGSYKCVCDHRYYSLDLTSNRCVRNDNDSLYIFFAHGQSIWNISQDGDNFQLEKAGLQKTAMIDLDVQDRRLYYVDIGANVIGRIHFDSAFAQTIQSYDVDGTEGLALDWINNKLYTVRSANVFVQEADGSYRKTLYKNVLKLPRALVVYPQKGLLFASDWGQSPFIAQAHTDGTKFTKIIEKGLVWPNGLAIDYYADQLFWADAYVDIIECSKLDGSNRRTVLQDSSSVPHVFGLTVFDDYLYWTDWTYRGILRAKKFHGENVTVVAQAALLPYGLKIFHKAAQPRGKNPCANETCSQLCLISPASDGSKHTEALCACADGFELAENGSCIANCGPKELYCGEKDQKCLSKKFRCDGTNQCSSGADEQDCQPRVCLPTQFQCHNRGGCLPTSQVCDGITQCGDSSDEKYC